MIINSAKWNWIISQNETNLWKKKHLINKTKEAWLNVPQMEENKNGRI